MFKRSKRSKDRLLTQKLLAWLLSIVMIAGTLMLPVGSTDAGAARRDEIDEPTPIAEEAWTPELAAGDLPLDELVDARLDDADIPAVISRELADARQHVNRLYEQECDDCTVMFQNRDGSKTIYIFSVSVKNSAANAETMSASNPSTEVGVTVSTQSNGVMTLSLQRGGLASRLGNSLATEPLYDYNIGSCELIRFGTVLTTSAAASGTDITASAREWGRPREGAADALTLTLEVERADGPLSAASATGGSVGNELICFTMTYSTLAGEYALKNSNKYLSNSAGSPRMLSSLYAPMGKWLFELQSDGSYMIRSQSDQQKYLVAGSGSAVLGARSEATGRWICDYDAGTISPYGDSETYLTASMTLGTKAEAGTWVFSNRVIYVDVSSITITPSGSTQAIQSLLARDGESYYISVTYSPSNATYPDIEFDLPDFVEADDAATELSFNDSGEGTISYGYKYNTSRCTGTIPVTVAPSSTPARFGNMIFTISQGSGSGTKYITAAPDTSDVTWDTNSRLAATADSSVIKRPDDYDTQFYVSPVTGTDLYAVKSISAEKYLAVDDSELILSATAGATSTWRIIELSNGKVVLWNPATTGMLCTESSESLLVGDGYDEPEWDLRIAGVYRLQNASSGKYMSVKDGYDTDMNNGDNPDTINIVTESMNADNSERDLDSNQHFRVVYKNGSYLLYPICSMNGSRRVIGKATVGAGQVLLKNYSGSGYGRYRYRVCRQRKILLEIRQHICHARRKQLCSVCRVFIRNNCAAVGA